MPLSKSSVGFEKPSKTMHLMARARSDKKRLSELQSKLDENKYVLAYQLDAEKKKLEEDLKRIRNKTITIALFPVPAVRRKPPERPIAEANAASVQNNAQNKDDQQNTTEPSLSPDNVAIDTVMVANMQDTHQ